MGFTPGISPQFLHCIAPLQGVSLEEKQCGHPCAPPPAAPSCRPAEQNFIDYFTPTNPSIIQHSNPLHCTCVLAKANMEGGDVPSPSGQARAAGFANQSPCFSFLSGCTWRRSSWVKCSTFTSLKLKPCLGKPIAVRNNKPVGKRV